MNGDNILITGGNGFIGSFVTQKFLKDENNNIFILMRKNSSIDKIKEFIDKKNLQIIFYNEIESFFLNTRIDFIAHIATNYIKYDELQDHKLLIEDNITIPLKILELSIRNNLKGYINTGTFFEVDDSIDKQITEESKIRPFNFYARTKIGFQKILETYANKINLTTLRLFSPYGPKDNEKVIPAIIKSILNKKELNIENPNINCDFTYVEDIADAYLNSVKGMKEQRKMPKLINVCSGKFYPLFDVINILQEISKEKLNINFNNDEFIKIKESSNALASNTIDWSPTTSLKNGLEKTFKYYKKTL